MFEIIKLKYISFHKTRHFILVMGKVLPNQIIRITIFLNLSGNKKKYTKTL